MQGNLNFFATFCINNLVVPNNFVPSLSLSLSHIGQAYPPHFFLLAYAREACRATPVNKGLFGVSFVRSFMPFYELDLEQNKNEMTAILNNKQDALTAFPLKMK